MSEFDKAGPAGSHRRGGNLFSFIWLSISWYMYMLASVALQPSRQSDSKICHLCQCIPTTFCCFFQSLRSRLKRELRGLTGEN